MKRSVNMRESIHSNIGRSVKSNVCQLHYGGQGNELPYFTFEGLRNTGIVEHCFTTRKGGVSSGYLESLNFSINRGDTAENIAENYRRVAALFGKTPSDIVCSAQTHTTNVRKVTAADKGKGTILERDYNDVDGLITDEAGIILATFYADCVPLFIVDPINKAIGLSHSGWRGTVGKMGQVTLEAMAREYGTNPAEVRVAVAPSICQSCYEVGQEVVAAFDKAFPRDNTKAVEYLERYQQEITEKAVEDCLVYQKQNGKYQLNLWYANFRVFRDAGVPNEHIEITDICTCCNPDVLFSHRASNGKRGNLGAFLMLTD